MQSSLKKKSLSLPRLRKVDFRAKSQNLVKLLCKQKNQAEAFEKPVSETRSFEIIDPQQSHKQKVQKILQKSKSMIEKNKDKIEKAKKFRTLKKKSVGPFLTGVDIYKEQQENSVNFYNRLLYKQEPKQEDSEQILQRLLREKYDDLSQLRRLIKKTSQNLGAYKQQTMNIKKNLLYMAFKIDEGPIHKLGRNKLFHHVYEFDDEM